MDQPTYFSRMVNPDLDGLEGKWDKDESISRDEQLKIPTDSRLYAVQVNVKDLFFCVFIILRFYILAFLCFCVFMFWRFYVFFCVFAFLRFYVFAFLVFFNIFGNDTHPREVSGRVGAGFKPWSSHYMIELWVFFLSSFCEFMN